MSRKLMYKTIAQAFKAACLAELQAMKPGNVHIFADGHGMVVQDFIKSAEVVSHVIAQPDLSVGDRILKSIEATYAAVACNTNLGIVLLCAVIVEAALRNHNLALKNRIAGVLHGLTIQDATLAFRAISLAKPAGLGDVKSYDVNESPQVSLLEAMQAAQDRDLIAQQYSKGFIDIFELGVTSYESAMAQWDNPTWATTLVYLSFMAQFPDSHLVRKYGLAIAEQVQQDAKQHLVVLQKLVNPKLYLRTLMIWDADLKQRGLNPGTSADLTVATLFVIACETCSLISSSS